MPSTAAPARVLPPGVTAQVLDEFFTMLEDSLGKEKVSRDSSSGALPGPTGKEIYGDLFTFGGTHTPAGAVRPINSGEIQAVVRAANQFKVPLWTVSRGRNLGYGGSAPVVQGSVVIDLHLMNRIVEIDEAGAYAIVEPGVSFFDLFEEIERRELKLWIACPAIGWGSVLGNCLERGVGYSPKGAHFQNQSGMEVVLPNGELLRTGMGAMGDGNFSALYRGGFGPSIDGLFFQSNLGIVTQLGIQLLPAPEAYMECAVSVDEEQLPAVIDVLQDFVRRGVISNYPAVSYSGRHVLQNKEPEVMERVGPYLARGRRVPHELTEEIRLEKGWGYWNASFCFAGTTEVVPALFSSVKRGLDTIPSAKMTVRSYPGKPGVYLKSSVISAEEDPEEISLLSMSGTPKMDYLEVFRNEKLRASHADFSPILPPSGKAAYEWHHVLEKATEESDMIYFTEFQIFDRYILGVAIVMFLPDQQENVHELLPRLIGLAKSNGYTVYRTHIDVMDVVSAHYDFNNNALSRYTTLLKDATDPNGILSPGKSGVWNSKKLFYTK